MTTRYALGKTGVIWILLVACMLLSQPNKLPVVLLIVPFVLLFVALYSLWQLATVLRARVTGHAVVAPHRRLGVAVTASAVLLLVLQSLGQLTFKDTATVIAIVIIGYIYSGRVQITKPKD